MTRTERAHLAALLDRADVHSFLTDAIIEAHDKAENGENTTGVVDEVIAALRAAA